VAAAAAQQRRQESSLIPSRQMSSLILSRQPSIRHGAYTSTSLVLVCQTFFQ
jgi:hypothetical protein